jgi:glycosyltransferase involved in cell wall biosynthesis
MSNSLPARVKRTYFPKSISVVAPCYNEEKVLVALRERLEGVLGKLNIPYEIIAVDDGSKDGTWEMLRKFQAENNHWKVIRLSRNWGHQTALTCGLDQSKGDVVLIIDADLQDPPELLTEMLTLWQDGFDVIYGKRTVRHGESRSKKFFAFFFYRLLSKITKIHIPEDTGDFRLIDRRALTALLSLRERHRFIRGLVSWVGYHQTPVFYERSERAHGETKYPFKKSLLLALDAITAFSYAPLRLATYLGFGVSGFAFIYIAVVILLKFLGVNFSGYTSMMASILLLGGVQLIVMGIIGEYVGRIFEQGQNRPLYFVDEICGEPLINNESK